MAQLDDRTTTLGAALDLLETWDVEGLDRPAPAVASAVTAGGRVEHALAAIDAGTYDPDDGEVKRAHAMLDRLAKMVPTDEPEPSAKPKPKTPAKPKPADAPADSELA